MNEKLHQLYFENIPYDFSIYRQLDESGHQGVLHVHDVFEVLFVRSGNITASINNQNYEISDNTLLLFTQMDLHQITTMPGRPYDRFVLYLCPEQTDAYSTEEIHLLTCFYQRPMGTPPIIPLTPEQADILYPLFSALNNVAHAEEPQHGDKLLQCFYTGEILIHINRFFMSHLNLPSIQSGATLSMIYSIINYISIHYMEKMTLSMLAQTVYISEHSLCRLFKQVTGTSPMNYVYNFRMSKAKDLLLHGCSVEETCTRVGFGNAAHFSRQFHKRMGVSPQQYAMQNRSQDS